MNGKNLRDLQPMIFSYFEQVLEENRLTHAYLFSGDFASYEMAIYLSQSLFCQEKKGVWACEVCRSCRLIASGEFSDVRMIAFQGTVIKKDTIRELVKQFSQSGFESNRQVFIIREADKMTAHAANALLKVMEEPQSDVHIFLLTNQESALLPTIKSRTQIVSFPKNQSLLQRLIEEKGLLKRQAYLLAHLTSRLDEVDNWVENKSFLELLHHAAKFVDGLLQDSHQAYLQVGSLTRLAVDKVDQERLFDLLSILLGEKMHDPFARKKLDHVLESKKMFQANVTLQHSLEYLVLMDEVR